MKLPPFEYAEPKTLRQACQLLEERRNQAQVVAGGTDLLVALKNRLTEPKILVDLHRVPRLSQIRFSETGGLRIGALVSLRQLASHPVVTANYPVLAQAALAVGTAQLQAMGTVGGNLCQESLCQYYNRSPMSRLSLEPCHKLGGGVCHAVSGSTVCWANYSGDVAPVLLTLRATLTIADSNGKKEIPVSRFYSGDGKRPNLLRRGQILTEIRVPPPAPHSAGVYLKLRQRKTIDYALLGVALQLTLVDGVCQDAALALTGVGRAPLLIRQAEKLRGRQIGEEAIAALADAAYKQAHPLNNVAELSPKYRKEMVKVYVRLAVQQAMQKT